MLNQRTVLVLGAGSSAEFGLPTGVDLSKAISDSTNFCFDGSEQTGGDSLLYQCLLRHAGSDAENVTSAGRVISDGLPLARSIDEFLANHSHDPLVTLTGKAAIAQGIVRSEVESRLNFYNDQDAAVVRNKFHALSDTWIYKLFGHLQTEVPRTSIENIFTNLSIITFNYDRCVEHFFVWALRFAYGISLEEAQRVVAKLDIVHVYGKVGRLPWQGGDGPEIEFGPRGETPNPVLLASGIRTLSEQHHNDADLSVIRQSIRECDTLIFLGFAFHPQNVRLLERAIDVRNRWPKAYATACAASMAERVVFNKCISRITGGPELTHTALDLPNQKCGQFIGEYGRLFAE